MMREDQVDQLIALLGRYVACEEQKLALMIDATNKRLDLDRRAVESTEKQVKEGYAVRADANIRHGSIAGTGKGERDG